MGPDVLTNVSDRKAEQEEKECQKVNKKINDFRALQSKVSAIRDLGKSRRTQRFTAANHGVMVQTGKR